jgi:PAS domain S-box-containing protein
MKFCRNSDMARELQHRETSIAGEPESAGLRLDGRFTSAAVIAGIATAGLGFSGAAGAVLGMPALQSFGYGVATMKMNTAVSLLLAGTALAFTARRPVTRIRARVALACAILTTFIGAASLLEYVLELDLGIDQLLIHEPVSADGAPAGRMAPNTAACFLLIGAALVFFDSKDGTVSVAAQAATLLVLSIAFLAISGYLFSVESLRGVAGYTSMALPTAIAFATLSAGLLASRTDRGVAAILASPQSAGTAIRRLLPLLILVPLLLAWLQLQGVAAGHFGTGFGAALTATATVGLLCSLALRNAHVLEALELERSRAGEQIRLAMEGAPNGMVIVDAQGQVAHVNAEIERLFGYSRAELVGGPVEKLVPGTLRDAHALQRAHYQSKPVARVMAPAARALHGARKDGSVVAVEVGLNPIRMPQGDFVLATVVDIRNREQLERAEERERFFQLSADALCIANTDGYFVQVNPAFERILGYSREEMLAAPYTSFIHPDDLPATARAAQTARAGQSIADFRNRYRAKDGSYRWLQWRSMPDRAGLSYATARDITQELAATRALQASVEERGVLLQEVHHRVKNNLQIIVSMINMQARRLPAGAGRDALEECGSRVQAIGLIHENLYNSSDFAHIPFRDYVVRVVDNIFHASAGTTTIQRRVDVAPVALTMEKAIPCGLIVNELVTNAIKHAFPGERQGTVQVSLHEQDAGRLTLCVADDGVGLGDDFSLETPGTLGLILVSTLVEQLKGRLVITRAPGARFEISFPSDTSS